MKAKRLILTALLTLVSTGLATAGPGLDAIQTELGMSITVLEGQALADEKAQKALDQAIVYFQEALQLFGAGDVKSVSTAFKIIGKGMGRLEKAVKKEPGGPFAILVSNMNSQLWLTCSGMFNPGASLKRSWTKGDPQETLGKKMRRPLRAAEKGKFAQAVKKLASPYKVLVLITPDP